MSEYPPSTNAIPVKMEISIATRPNEARSKLNLCLRKAPSASRAIPISRIMNPSITWAASSKSPLVNICSSGFTVDEDAGKTVNRLTYVPVRNCMINSGIIARDRSTRDLSYDMFAAIRN